MPSSDSPLSLPHGVSSRSSHTFLLQHHWLSWLSWLSWRGPAVTENIKLIKLTFIFCHLSTLGGIYSLGFRFLVPGIARGQHCSNDFAGILLNY